MIEILKTLLFRYINSSVCFSQVSLQQDNQIYWSITFIFGQIQLLLIPYLKSQNNRFIKLLIYLTYPTKAYHDYVDDQLPLIIMIILTLLVIWLITFLIIIFGHLQSTNKLEQEDKQLTRKHDKLYQLYGKSDYMSLWFNISYHKKSFKLGLLQYTYIIINSYIVCYFKPILYYSILLLDFNNINILSLILLLLSLIFYFYCITYYSQSLTVYGQNYLSLQNNNLQIIILLLQVITFVLSIMSDSFLIVNMIILIIFILKIFSLFFYRLYKHKYKYQTYIICTSFGITYCLCDIFKLNILVLFVITPLLIRLMIKQYEREDLFQEYFIQPNNDDQNQQSLFQMLQLNQLYTQQYYFYSHLLQQFDDLQFKSNQCFSQQTQANIVRSKAIIRLVIIINKHQTKCNNNLCFCNDQYQNKINSFEKEQNQELDETQETQDLQLRINLKFISDYFRYHNKLVISKLISSSHIQIIQVNQIISYLSKSEQSFQSLLILQDLKTKLLQKNQKPSLMEQISIVFIKDYIKYNILEQKNNLVSYETLDQIYNYDQFRSVQKLQFKIIDKIENNITTKLQFLEKLESSSSHWFQQIEKVTSSYSNTIKFIEDKLKINNIRTVYLYRLYFEMNIRNNLVVMLKILQGLLSFETKFFEHSDSYYDLEYHSQEICYLKVDLNKSKQIDANGRQTRGQILDYSSNAPQFFKYQKSEFQLIQNIRELMPYSAKQTHDEFVEIFIQSQKPNVFRNNIPLFSKAQTGLLIYNEFFCDYNFKQVAEEFAVHVFLKKIKDKGGLNLQQGYIWINQHNYVEGITKNIMQNLEIPQSQLYLLGSYKIFELIGDIQTYMNQLNQQLMNYQQQFCGKQTIQTSQIIFQLELKQLKFRIPQKLTKQLSKTYLLDGFIQLKYMKLIELTYKVYIINVQNIVDQNEKFSFKLSIKTLLNEEQQLSKIGEELDDDKDDPDDQYNKQRNIINQCSILCDPDSRQINNDKEFKEQRESYLFSLPQSDRQFIDQEEKLNSKQFTDTIQDIQLFKYKKPQKQVQESNYNSSTLYTEQNRIIIKSQFYERFSRIESKYTKYNFLLNILIFSTYITYIVIITGQLDEYLAGSKELIGLISSTDNSDYAFNMMQFYNGIYNDTQINKSIQKLSAIIVEEEELLEEEVEFFDVMLNETAEHLLYDFLTLCKFQYTQVPYTKDLTQIIFSFDMFFDWAEDLTEDINREMEELQEEFYIKITYNIVIQVVLTLTAAIIFTTIIIKYESVISQIIGLQNLITLNALKSEIKFNDNLKGKLKYDNERRVMPIQIYEQQWDIQDKLVHMKDLEQQIAKQNYQTRGNQKQRIDIKQLEFKQLMKQILIGSFSLLLFTFISIPILIQILNYQQYVTQKVTIFKELIQLNEQITVIFASNQLILQDLEQDVFEEQLLKGYDKYLTISYQLINKQNKETIQDAFHSNLTGEYSNYTLYGAIQDLMKEIQSNQFKGFNYSQYQLYLIQEIYLSLESIESQYLESIFDYIDQNFGQFQIIYTFFFALLLIIQIIFAIIQQKRLKYRIKIISQLVFILPTISLYQEDIFYKTLQNISKTKQLLIL